MILSSTTQFGVQAECFLSVKDLGSMRFTCNHLLLTSDHLSYHTDGGPCGVELKDISIFPGDAGYSAAIEIFNQAYAQSRPAFVAFPLTEEHVMKCLRCSALHSVPCVVKSG